MLSKIRTRVTAVAATSALLLGASALGAGAAGAITNEHAVNGNDVSVTFALQPGEVTDTCVATLVTTAKAPTIAEKFTSMNLTEILKLLAGDDPDVIPLKTNTGSPAAVLAPFVTPTRTVTAKDVPSNVYSIVSYCLLDTGTRIDPVVLVGNPVEAGLGSFEAGSSGDNLAAASASLPTLLALLGGDGAGALASGS